MYKFKVGDRVKFEMSGIDTDTGTIQGLANDDSNLSDKNSYWIAWDSDGTVLVASEETLTLLPETNEAYNESIKTDEAYNESIEIIKQTVKKLIDCNDISLALKVLVLIEKNNVNI